MAGVSFSRALGIVFLLNEIEQVIHYQTKVSMLSGEESVRQDSGSSDTSTRRIEFINSLFGESITVFEKVTIQRMVYFFVFNVAVIFSDMYTVEPHIAKIY